MGIDKLCILWTSDNIETAKNMLLMYTLKANINNWWKECNLITWGPSNKLVGESPEIQLMLKELMDSGVTVYACKRCAEEYNLTEKLENLGITVKYMGEPLTEYLKDESCRVISI